MLLANISVAKKIYEHFPQHAVLRKHQKPPVSNFDILIKAAEGQVRLQSVAVFRWNPIFLLIFQYANLTFLNHLILIAHCLSPDYYRICLFHSILIAFHVYNNS